MDLARNWFIQRDDAYLSKNLNLPDLSHVIRLNKTMFIIGDTSSYYLYKDFKRTRKLEELSYGPKGDKKVLY